MKNKLSEKTVSAITELGKKFSDTTISMHEAIARKAGLTGTDHKYLGYLLQNGDMTAGELAQLTGLTTGAVTGLVDRLEKKGLVKRTADKQDRRKIVLVADHKKMDKILGTTSADLKNRMLAFFSTIPESEIHIIEKYLLATISIMNDFSAGLKTKTSRNITKLPNNG